MGAGSSSGSRAHSAADKVFVAWLVPGSHGSIGPSDVMIILVLHLALDLSMSQILALWTRTASDSIYSSLALADLLKALSHVWRSSITGGVQ